MRFTKLISAFALASSALAVTEYQAVELVKRFADSFLAPNNVEIAKKGNSTLFAPDVKGSLDIAGDFDGRELATEALFGLFARASETPEIPNFLGVPQAYNVTSLAVQRHFVSATIRVDLRSWPAYSLTETDHYTQIRRSYPIEIVAWFTVNDHVQIAQYDVTFKRWNWAMDEVVRQILPSMAQWAQTNSTDTAIVLKTYLGRTICGTNLLSCSGSNSQWTSTAECAAWVAQQQTGNFYRMAENTLSCRALHAALVPYRPGYHCAAMGPKSTVCAERDYTTTVKANHFPEGFLAPKVVTPENADEIGDYQVVDGVPIHPLLSISLNNDSLKSWDPTLFATATFVYMLVLWVNAKLLYMGYMKFSRRFRALASDVLRINVVMYVMNIFYTFAAVALQAVAIPAFWRDYHLYQVLCVRTAAVMVCGLYCFELVFRFDMRLPLVCHHFFTIFAVCFCVTLFEMTQDMTFLMSGTIWLCQATTEQPTFWGLYNYRMRKDAPVFTAWLLKLASIQTLVFKIASAGGVVVIWALNQRSTFRSIDIAWTVVMFIVTVGLMATQVWGSWITWKLGARVLYKHNKSRLAGLTREDAYATTEPKSHEFKLLPSPPAVDRDDPYAYKDSPEPNPRAVRPRLVSVSSNFSQLSVVGDGDDAKRAYSDLDPYEDPTDPFELPLSPVRWTAAHGVGYEYTHNARDSVYDVNNAGSGSRPVSRNSHSSEDGRARLVTPNPEGHDGRDRDVESGWGNMRRPERLSVNELDRRGHGRAQSR